MSAPNVKCPQCGGRLKDTSDANRYTCRGCGRDHHQCVVENIDTYQRLAESDTPASKIAEAALEGWEGEQ